MKTSGDTWFCLFFTFSPFRKRVLKCYTPVSMWYKVCMDAFQKPNCIRSSKYVAFGSLGVKMALVSGERDTGHLDKHISNCWW